MSTAAVIVEEISKSYRLGLAPERFPTFRDAIVSAMMSPIKRIRALGEHDEDGEDTFWALTDVSVEIPEGEVIGIIGRNGAGKSTLLKILSRITEPTKGLVRLRGRVASLLEVGTGFHPELTGRENIYLNGAILGMTRKETAAKFDDIVDFSEIGRFIDTPVKRFSSGMYTRLAFAVAAHLEPEILIIDEVLAVGDMAFQKKCLGKMGDVAKSGRTVLFVSHNVGAVAQLCSRCMLLKEGRIEAIGDTEPVIRKYLTIDRTGGHIDLVGWNVERQGLGPMRVTFLETVDEAGAVRSQFEYGESITFRFGVHGKQYSGCIFSVAIRDSLGRTVLHFDSGEAASELTLPSQESVVAVRMDQNILNDGQYHITVSVHDPCLFHDRVMNALAFTVETKMHGEVRGDGAVRVPVKWSVS